MNNYHFLILLPVANFIYSIHPWSTRLNREWCRRLELGHCWAKTALKRIFLTGEHPQGLEFRSSVARNFFPFSWAVLGHRNTLLRVWIMAEKNQNKTKKNPTPNQACHSDTFCSYSLILQVTNIHFVLDFALSMDIIFRCNYFSKICNIYPKDIFEEKIQNTIYSFFCTTRSLLYVCFSYFKTASFSMEMEEKIKPVNYVDSLNLRNALFCL